MKRAGISTIVSLLVMVGCGPSDPPAIKSIVELPDSIRIQYDPTRIINVEMREIARLQCTERGLILTDVTVARTASPNVSIANVFCG